MRPITQRYGNRIGNKRQHAISLIYGQFGGKPSIQHEHHPILSDHVRLKERHSPAIDHNVVVRERAGEADAERRKLGAVVVIHLSPVSWSGSRFLPNHSASSDGLQGYLNDYVWRYNHRKNTTRSMFDILIDKAAA